MMFGLGAGTPTAEEIFCVGGTGSAANAPPVSDAFCELSIDVDPAGVSVEAVTVTREVRVLVEDASLPSLEVDEVALSGGGIREKLDTVSQLIDEGFDVDPVLSLLGCAEVVCSVNFCDMMGTGVDHNLFSAL